VTPTLLALILAAPPADLRSAALTRRGDPATGAKLFADARLKCATCHTTDGKANLLGPDLSAIGNKFDRPHLVESILEPSRQIVEGYRITTLELADGRVVSGVVKAETPTAVTLLDIDGRTHTVRPADVEQRTVAAHSPMPDGLADQLTPAEFADLIAHLETLRGTAKPSFGSGLTGPIELPPGFAVDVVTTGLSAATGLEVAPDGRVFVCEQTGALKLVKDGKLLPEPFAKFDVDTLWERGLLGVTVDPGFPKVPHVYVHYTGAKPYPHTVVSRLTAAGDKMVPGSEVKLFEGDDQRAFKMNIPGAHQGGGLHFGPDGKLYFSVGELTAEKPAQDKRSQFGKILRINPDGTIPSDNPFTAELDGKYRAVWAYGLRNPFGFALQPETGRLWACDVGSNKHDEVNAIVKGGNYGWPVGEGMTDDPRFVPPVHTYPAASIVGAAFSPAAGPWPAEWRGKFFFMDFMHGWVRALDPEAPSKPPTELVRGVRRPIDLRFGPDGGLYILVRDAWVSDGQLKTGTGSVLRVRYTGGR
jgi:putative heme-binding domain-containing protein